jgi:hypothetical protein
MGIHGIDEFGNSIEWENTPVKKEKEIEDFVEKNPSVLDKNIFIIGRQIETDINTRIDLMGLDNKGNTAIIEFKKDMSPRNAVSQILEYGIWAENQGYEKLNEIAKKNHLSDNLDLYKKFESDFEDIPDPFNQNQRLYIIAEKIDIKTETMCRYLRKRGIDISCITINFFEKEGKKIVRTDMVVGEEKIAISNNEKINEKRKTWEERLSSSDNENKERIAKFIEKVKTKYGFRGIAKNAWYYFYKNKSDKETQVIAIICNIHTARIAFRVNSESFDIKSENISPSAGWFFPKGEEYRIRLNENNLDVIWKCLDHTYEKV